MVPGRSCSNSNLDVWPGLLPGLDGFGAGFAIISLVASLASFYSYYAILLFFDSFDLASESFRSFIADELPLF